MLSSSTNGFRIFVHLFAFLNIMFFIFCQIDIQVETNISQLTSRSVSENKTSISPSKQITSTSIVDTLKIRPSQSTIKLEEHVNESFMKQDNNGYFKPEKLGMTVNSSIPRLDRVSIRLNTSMQLLHIDRGVELTFVESVQGKVFMMVRGNAFIHLDGDAVPTFQLRLCREISFQFRTRLPHGLLVYHSVKDRPTGSPPYALYIIVEKGQLKVVHVFGKHSTSLTVSKGLNRDTWHNVVVRIDVHGARLLAKVDDIVEEINLQGLDKSSNYGISADLSSVVLIGGLSPEEKLHGVKYIIESFVGCIKDIILSAGKAASDLLPINPLIATKHENVQEGCINQLVNLYS